ncbi:MAG: S-methyl-5-thioribose-1-phosphate isomerase [Deltaproteobacteria bacterium]|nr:S-methyl-5-thioribose-1-phosphate isomerase [Deltaproteobacteria bacterium]
MEDPFRTIQWMNDHIRLLDQTLLPKEERYIEIYDLSELCDAIKRLAVRGAPAIGVAAAMGVALGMLKAPAGNIEVVKGYFENISSRIAATRPTAVNLFWALDRMKEIFFANLGLNLSELQETLIQEAVSIESEDRRLCERIGMWGRDLFKDGDVILTHCNAGGLATAGYGTAIGVIRAAFEAGRNVRVYADETRPLNQGSRITAWELNKLGIPVTLITDSTAGALMQAGEINKAIVGADRIAANGDTANKIGTYSVAVLAKRHDLPFYVAAPLSTIDMKLATGKMIPIEERDPAEVTHICGNRIAPEGVSARNIAFDVTPNELISAIVTEKGVAERPFEDSLRALFA